MKCPKCGSNKVERVIIPSLSHVQISKFITPGSFSEEPIEKIKCLNCGHSFTD